MSKVNWHNRPIKKLVRTLVASFAGKDKRSALFFPADHALDALALKDAGVIDGLTNLLAVEKNPTNAKKALQVLQRNGLGNCKGRKTHVHADFVHTLDLANQVMKTGKHLDFAWFDYCGFFMNHEAAWTKLNAPLFMTENSDVLFTFQAVIRGRAIPTAYFTHVEAQTMKSEIRAEMRAIGKLETMHVRDDGSIYTVPATNAMRHALALRRIGIRNLLSGYEFDIRHTTYKDRDPLTQDDRGSGMILLHLHNIRVK